MPGTDIVDAFRSWYSGRRLKAWLRREPHGFTVTTFRGCRFYAGPGNKIEAALLRGGQTYDRANFTAVTGFVRPGHVCFDIGANIGVYSVVMASLTGAPECVHAFEPVAHIRRRLLANARLNAFDTIHVNDMALGATETTLDMYQVKQGLFRAGTSTLVRNQNVERMGEDAFAKKAVSVTTLDRYVGAAQLARVDFLKIDVEGFELHVLEGARTTLARHRPVILFEYDEGRHGTEHRERFRAIFAEHDYDTFEFTAFRDRLAIVPFDFERTPIHRNLLCLHQGPGTR